MKTSQGVGAGGSGILGLSAEEEQLQKALQLSLETNNYSNSSYEPLAPRDRKREKGIPVGLKNVGNT